MKIKNLFTATLLICLSFISKTNAQEIVIEDVSVIPINVNQVLEHQDVLVKNGKIITIRNHVNSDTKTKKWQHIDGTGKFLIPSYADAHVHLPERELLPNFFLMNLYNGVTTFRSMRGEDWHPELKSGTPFSPRYLLGSSPVTDENSLDEKQANELVVKNKQMGFDFIKVLDVKNKSTFTNLVNACKTNNFKMAGHSPNPTKVSAVEVCESGVYQSLEHLGGFFSARSPEEADAVIEATKKYNVYSCPTLDYVYGLHVSEADLKKRPGIEYVPKATMDLWQENYSISHEGVTADQLAEHTMQMENFYKMGTTILGKIYQKGAKLLLSPDASGEYAIPGFRYQEEMNHFASAGVSNYDILKAACYNLSEMNLTTKAWGSIEVGSMSDLLLLNANPITDIKNANQIEGVLFRGTYYTRKDIENRLSQTVK